MEKKDKNRMLNILIQSLSTLYCVGWRRFGGTVHSMEWSLGAELWSGVLEWSGVIVWSGKCSCLFHHKI